MTDSVNHPKHYNGHPSGVECIEIVEHLGFCLGNAVKYLWRAGLKGDGGQGKEDLSKAAWYLRRYVGDVTPPAMWDTKLGPGQTANQRGRYYQPSVVGIEAVHVIALMERVIAVDERSPLGRVLKMALHGASKYGYLAVIGELEGRHE